MRTGLGVFMKYNKKKAFENRAEEIKKKLGAELRRQALQESDEIVSHYWADSQDQVDHCTGCEFCEGEAVKKPIPTFGQDRSYKGIRIWHK
jgi:hypothetical protein